MFFSPRSLRGDAMFAATFIQGELMNCWYTMATLRSRTGMPVTSTPSTVTRPAVGGSSPAMMRMRLVFPAPAAPRPAPRRGRVQPGHDAHEAGLARLRGAQQHRDGAAVQRQAHLMEPSLRPH